MARTLVFQFEVTIPAGTLKTAPLVTPTTFEPGVVERIEWRFPHGCNGLVGIQIGARGVTILPQGAGNFFTMSGDSHSMAVEDLHTTGDWSVIGFNTGLNPHTIRVTFVTRRKEPPIEPQLVLFDDVISDFPVFDEVSHG